jgi:hypothetical protein
MHPIYHQYAVLILRELRGIDNLEDSLALLALQLRLFAKNINTILKQIPPEQLNEFLGIVNKGRSNK